MNVRVFEKNIEPIWFLYIQSGQKKFEGRLKKKEFAQCQVGDIFVWTCGINKSKTRVVSLQEFNSWYSYLNTLGIENCLPGVETIEQGIKVYTQWYPEYPDVPIVAIGVEVIKE